MVLETYPGALGYLVVISVWLKHVQNIVFYVIIVTFTFQV
jgi:hypothetical protein